MEMDNSPSVLSLVLSDLFLKTLCARFPDSFSPHMPYLQASDYAL